MRSQLDPIASSSAFAPIRAHSTADRTTRLPRRRINIRRYLKRMRRLIGKTWTGLNRRASK
jgi:hypothetical protein